MVSSCGKTAKEAAMTSLEEYVWLDQAYSERHAAEWERTRWLGWLVISGNPYIEGASKPKKPKDLIRLPGDESEEAEAQKIPLITPEEVAILNKIAANYGKK